ncbi:ASCH domain-containing protein [Dactylosporangium darangshiense]|uniref:ASCH domain-containing protein n=1 Tax=Dactylosporangium darangshiense TaxID=579108 RepID=A0ABP8DID5_9ACTN
MTVERTLLLSLRPRFADAILAGTKTIEVRRRPVNASAGTPIILYASSPRRAVVGTARLSAVHSDDHNTAWRRYRHTLGLARREFDAYLEGTSQVYLLHLGNVCRLNQPLPLQRLREDGPFQPPQSFRYVAASDPSRLRDLVHPIAALTS